MDHNNGSKTSERYLLEKVLDGDHSAFSIIIRNTEKLVAQIVFKMISNTEDRKDISQDIYLKTFKNLKQFKFQSKLSTWIGQIAYNTCLNYLEKKKMVLLDYNFSDETQEGVLEKLLRHQSIMSAFFYKTLLTV
ncbi:RNA polymerase sigma factor [Chryseobacterium sp. M5A1_1a]